MVCERAQFKSENPPTWWFLMLQHSVGQIPIAISVLFIGEAVEKPTETTNLLNLGIVFAHLSVIGFMNYSGLSVARRLLQLH